MLFHTSILYHTPLYSLACHEDSATTFQLSMLPTSGLLPSISLHLPSGLKARGYLRTRTGRYVLSRANVLTLYHGLTGRYSIPWRSLLACSHVLLLLYVGCRARWHAVILLHVLLRWPALTLLHVGALYRLYVLRLLHVLGWSGWDILFVWCSIELTGLCILSILHSRW